MGAIFTKELKSYFTSSLGYVYLGAFFLMAAIGFLANLLTGNIDMLALLSGWTSIVFILPILTASMFVKERKNGTDRLIYTSPVSVCSIVLGKFFAALVFYIISVILTIVFSCIFISHSKLSLGVILNSYFSVIMYGSLILSIGLFFGSLFKKTSPAILASMGFMYLLNQIQVFKNFQNTPKWLVSTIDFLSVNNKFQSLFTDIINPEIYVYFISLTAVFLVLTILSINVKEGK